MSLSINFVFRKGAFALQGGSVRDLHEQHSKNTSVEMRHISFTIVALCSFDQQGVLKPSLLPKSFAFLCCVPIECSAQTMTIKESDRYRQDHCFPVSAP